MLSLLRVLALVVFLLPRFTAARDSSFLAAPSLPSNYVPSLITDPDSTGFWASGMANGMPVLVRYASDGSLQATNYPSANALIQGDFVQFHALANYPDGGVIEIDSVNNLGSVQCYTRRFDAGGRLRWVVPQCGDVRDPSLYAKAIQVDGAGNIWIRNGPRIASDGLLLDRVQDDTVNGGQLVDPKSDAVYAYGCIGYAVCRLNSTSTIATIQKVTSKGIAWTVQAPQGSSTATALNDLAVGNDDNLYGYGIQLSTSGGAASLYGMSTSANGNTRWQRTFPIDVTNANVFAAAGPGGKSEVLSINFQDFLSKKQSTAPTIASISPDSTLQWQTTAGFQAPAIDPTTYFSSIWAALRAASNGDIVSALQYCDASVSPHICPLQQSRLDAAGNVLYAGKAAGSDNAGAMSFALLADSSSIAVDSTAFRRLDRYGNTLTPPQTVAAIQAASWDVAGSMARDGSAYLLSANGSTNSYAMTAYANDGTRQWTTVLTAKTERGVPIAATVVARDADVCLIGILDAAQIVQCYSRSTGTPAAPIPLAAGIPANSQRWSAAGLANGQLLVLYDAADGSTHHALLDAQLHLVHDISLLTANEAWGTTSINTNGSVLIQTAAGALVKFRTDGTRAYSITPDIKSYTLKLADDETALLSQTAPGAVIERFDATGNLLWKSVLPLLQQSSKIATRGIRFSSSDVYFYLYDSPPIVYASNTGPFSGYVVKLALSDGHMAWNSAFPYVRGSGAAVVAPPTLLLDVASQRLLLLTSLNARMRFRTLSTQDGTELAQRVESMGVENFVLHDLFLTDDGALRLINDTTDTISGSAWQVDTFLHPFAVAPPIRIDQPGIAGTWYAPYSTGQGFVLDYIAGANTVFMPWFTFAQTQANAPSGNVWYTLQGQPSPSATTVDLQMYAADSPGVFSTGKTGAKQLGTAQLSFTDCSHATLRYQFDPTTNLGTGGAISLTRLTPQTRDCLLADGSTQTAPAAAPAQGFDVRQSGSWYDPNTSGQGIELSVIPPSNGSNGLLFGAWFTYDPAGAGDDPLNQYWFTLQSELAGANSGKVTLPILQILGGTLDGMPTRNSSQVGTAVLTFSGCDKAQLDYQFADSAVAHAYAGLKSTLQLTKLGGCSPP